MMPISDTDLARKLAEVESTKPVESPLGTPRTPRTRHRAWQAGDPTITIHVKAGAEHKALLYLMCQINRHFGMDDIMPDPDGDAADFAFEVLRLPPGEMIETLVSTYLHILLQHSCKQPVKIFCFVGYRTLLATSSDHSETCGSLPCVCSPHSGTQQAHKLHKRCTCI